MRDDDVTLQRFRAEVVAKRNLPTIPPVLASILQILGSDTAGARQLVEVIEKDQSLTAKLLRLANAAFFGQSRRVATIPRAILLLGFSTVRNLALGVKVWDAVGSGVAKSRLVALWTHAVVVGTCARALGGGLRACDPDEAFTAGLLHDIGRVLLAAKFGDAYWSATAPADGDVRTTAEREREAFAVDHAEVGGWMLEAWSLPPLIVEAVRLHHERVPRGGLPRVLAVTNALVHCTDVQAATLDPSAEALVEPFAGEGLTVESWNALVARLRDGGALDGMAEVWT